MDKLKTIRLKKGVNISFLKSDRFKTNMISVYFRFPLEEKKATMAALLPKVLKRGSKKYPTMAEISKKGEELYAASVSAGISKRGDSQSVRFSVESVADKFISESITKDVIALMASVMLEPKTIDGVFDKEYVRQEKDNLKSFIEGIINDKKDYAALRANEIMFEGDPYGVFECGRIEDLAQIDEKNLYEFYEDMKKTAAIDIFVSGSFDEETVKSESLEVLAPIITDRDAKPYTVILAKNEDNIEVKRVTEEMQVVQSKLVMGFNTNAVPVGKDFYALALFSCIYGGSPFSKLFNNVRERLSLAYYCSSGVDRQKCCMKISAGIEAEKYEAAYNEIFAQLDKMKNGEFTDDEIVSAKKYMSTAVNSIKDSLGAAESFYLGTMLLNTEETPEEYLEGIKAVSREEIIAAANGVQLDTVYFLKGGKGSEV